MVPSPNPKQNSFSHIKTNTPFIHFCYFVQSANTVLDTAERYIYIYIYIGFLIYSILIAIQQHSTQSNTVDISRTFIRDETLTGAAMKKSKQ